MKKPNFDKNMKIINKILKNSAKENHAKFIEIKKLFVRTMSTYKARQSTIKSEF